MAELSVGKDAPKVVNLVIEIRRGEGKNKYELDKKTGYLVLDRVNATMLKYPCDYGYVPNTLCEDGDPLDGLLVIDESVPQNIVVPSRAIGVLYMVDDGEGDEKLICVADDDVTMQHIQEVEDLGGYFKPMVEQFYSHYKDWKNDWKGVEVHFNGWGNADAARKVILESIERHTKS
ncbi:MAG TPA: inorganic diphosphatase [Candidatus Saccharimonadia bacterium]